MFRVQCPSCRKIISLKDELYGQKVSCKCGHVLRLPRAPDDNTLEDQNFVRFSCSTCKRKLRVKSDSEGKIIQCPCGAKNQAPSRVEALLEDAMLVEPELVAEPADDIWNGLDDPFAVPGQPASPLMTQAAYNNPYSPPPRPSNKKKTKRSQRSRVSSSDVQQVIRGQKMLIYSLLAYIGAIVLALFSGFVIGTLQADQEAAQLIGVGIVLFCTFLIFCAAITGIIGVGRMGNVVIGPYWWLLIPFMFCVGFFVVVIINVSATAYLRAKGVEVGFLGAK